MIQKIWEPIAYLCLGLTILGQVLTASNVLLAQMVWLVSNVLFVARDMALQRPVADKVKDVSMLILTGGLIIYLFLN